MLLKLDLPNMSNLMTEEEILVSTHSEKEPMVLTMIKDVRDRGFPDSSLQIAMVMQNILQKDRDRSLKCLNVLV